MDAIDPFVRIRAAVENAGAGSSDFDLNPGVVLPEGRKLRPAAVLVPLIEIAGELRVILTKRSSALKHHPGQISFPGGKVEDHDASIAFAALREAHEEIGLDPANVDVIGELPGHETVTSFQVSPVLGRVRADFEPEPQLSEVAEVFSVPFAHVMDPNNYYIQSRLWQGQARYYYTVPYGPYYIWGATARILRGLADRMAE